MAETARVRGRDALNVVAFGAHPDDDEIKLGGTAALWARRGDRVLFVSIADGDAGHQTAAGGALARRRRAEAEAAARTLGVRSLVLEHHDGQVVPTLALRGEIVRIIREARADLVLLPRPWDYHPDHRGAAVAVQDAAALVRVPHILPLTPRLDVLPVFAYVGDRFTQPAPLRPDVVVDTTAAAETKLRALHCHASQFYEWLAYNYGRLHEVPATEARRLEWLRATRLRPDEEAADRYRALLVERYGEERGRAARFAEPFEVCEFGRQPAPGERDALFPVGGG